MIQSTDGGRRRTSYFVAGAGDGDEDAARELAASPFISPHERREDVYSRGEGGSAACPGESSPVGGDEET